MDKCEEEILVKFEECEQKLQKLLERQGCADGLVASDVAAASAVVIELEGCVVRLAGIASLSPSVQLDVVKRVLQLCRHGDLTAPEALALQLASLFKVTYSVLKGCLDAITGTPAARQICGPQTNSLLKDVTEIASLSLYFDPSVLALCWRSVGRVVCGGRATAERSEVMPHVVEQLSLAISTTCSQSLQEVDPLLEKRLRSGRFLCSLLLRVLSEFAVCSCECAGTLLQLLLSIHQTVCAVGSPALRSKLQSAFLLLREPVVECMSSHKPFLQLMLDQSKVCLGQHYGWGLCLAVVMKQLPSLPDELQSYCLESLTSTQEDHSCRLLECVFGCLESCYPELVGSGPAGHTVKNGQSQCSLSLYELLCTHVGVVLVAVSQESLLHCMERSLMAHLLSAHPFPALLSADCLVLMARLGGETMAASQCLFVLELLNSLPLHVPSMSSPLLFLGSLLNRLLALLSPPLQTSLLSGHAPPGSWLWAHVKLHCLQGDTVSVLLPQLLTQATRQLEEGEGHGFQELGPSLQCLCSIYQQQLLAGEEVSSVGDNSVVERLLQLVHSSKPYLPELSLHLLSYLVSGLATQHMTKGVEIVHELVIDAASLSLILALCHLMDNLYLVSSKELVGRLCQCYHQLLSCEDWLVMQHGLECFRHFAEMTPHAGAVESCIPPHLTDTIIHFLHKVPHGEGAYHSSPHQSFLLSSPSHQLSALASPSYQLSSSPTHHHSEATTHASLLVESLATTWQELVACKEPLSPDSKQQLTTLHSSISDFLSS